MSDEKSQKKRNELEKIISSHAVSPIANLNLFILSQRSKNPEMVASHRNVAVRVAVDNREIYGINFDDTAEIIADYCDKSPEEREEEQRDAAIAHHATYR